MKKASIAAALLVTFSWLAGPDAHARSAGISGRAEAGCGGSGCHLGAADPGVSVTIAGPSTFAPGGAPAPILVTLSGGPQPTPVRGGFDLLAGLGSLAADTSHPDGADLNPWGSRELSHSFFSTFRRQWAAKWTPPSIGTLCAIPLSAAANAVNGNGVQDAGDKWNKKAITVTVDTSGDAAPPTGAFRAPQPGSAHVGDTALAPVGVTVVLGAIMVQITANDDVGIASVALYDEDLTGQAKIGDAVFQGLTDGDTKNLFRVRWDALTEPPGPHTLTAEITDCDGNVTTVPLDVFVL